MKFKIFVINLDSSQDRLVSMQAQCDRLGITFERVPAVRGSLLSAEEKAQIYDVKTNNAKYYKLLNDGEIGCYLSHVRCWERILSDNLDYALILEDDALLTEAAPAFIRQLETLSPDWDYIKLSHGSKMKRVVDSFALGDGLSLNTCVKLPSTCTGQFVSRAGAVKLLRHAYPIARPIDTEIQYWVEKSLRCFVARPFPVLNGDFGSEINKAADRTKAQKRALWRIWLKFKYEIMMLHGRFKLPPFPHKISR